MKKINTIVDPKRQLVVNTVYKNPTADEYITALKGYLDKRPQKYVIWDFSNADVSALKTNDLEMIMEFSMEHPNRHVPNKVAMIVSSDLAYGLARMFQMFGQCENSPWEIQVFRNTDQAMQWFETEIVPG